MTPGTHGTPGTPVAHLVAGVVAVLRARRAADLAPVLETLLAAGVTRLELTLTTPGVIDELAALRDRLDPTAVIAVGTVTTPEQVVQCAAAGPDFLVTPNTDPAVLGKAGELGLPIVPGGLTPGELVLGSRLGSGPVKLFPASTVGPEYLRHLHGPFPDLAVMPSGGVDIEAIPEWVAAGAPGVSLGGPLIGDALSGGSLTELRGRAERAVAVFAQALEAAHG